MCNYRKNLGLFALVCILAGLAGCGGASGTDGDTSPLDVCSDHQVILENGQCGEPPPLPACPEGQIRVGDSACFVPDFPPPVYTPGPNEAVIYFNKRDKDFNNYSLHLWNACGGGWADTELTTWPAGPAVASAEGGDLMHDPIYGAYFIVQTNGVGNCGNFIIKKGAGDDQTNDLSIDLTYAGGPYERMYFVIADPVTLRNSQTSVAPICIDDICEAYEQPALAINNVAAHWIDQSTILWRQDLSNVELYSSATGEIAANDDGSVANGTLVAELTPTVMTTEQMATVPHMSEYFAYTVDLPVEDIKSLLKQQLLIVGDLADSGRAGTEVQKALLLDALYTAGENDADEAKLGVNYVDGGVSVSVWAPTAQKVELRLYSNDLSLESTQEMTLDNATGIWSYTGGAELDRKFYRFRVTGYNPVTGVIEVLEVTDPYSVSLSTNGRHSQFVNLADADLKPDGWDSHAVPTVVSPEAMSIYEVHVRDFSIRDTDTPEEHRGKYLAFTDTGTAPVAHLQALADAGLTHVHFLPINDFSSVEEDESEQANLDSVVYELCDVVSPRNSAPVCNGEEDDNTTLLSVFQSYSPYEDFARNLANAMSGYDGFNWGYDPQHFNAPEGSYATDPHGVARIVEMRAMNMALHNMGLRVVMDVVYPHTAAAGVATANSTFDKIVPGYYYRNNVVTGIPETVGSNAGPDTATEHQMMGKFLTDSVAMWAEQYKVDGFRFDQSGLIPKDVLVNAWEAVKAVDPDNYFYGEAWTLNALGRVPVLATQQNLAGTGIGTFNDRIRNPLRELALINAGGNENAIRAGLAGNLSAFRLVTNTGATVEAGSVGAYNLDPQEAVNYVSKHDEETLWDWMHHPDALPEDTALADRVRIHNLTTSIPLLSQGVPFFHMGVDILRSKSMSQNSYNAGDWFNTVDFTKQTNNWNVGLPVELRDSLTDQDVLEAIIDSESTPAAAEIMQASAVFNEFLSIASSSPLFSLTTAEEVMDRVGFHNSGTTQVDNLIVMSINDGVGTVAGTDGTPRADLDPNLDAIVVVFNGNATAISHPVVTSAGFTLYSMQQTSVDSVVQGATFAEATGDATGGTFTVPAYTTAVFVKVQGAAQGQGLEATATSGYEPPVPYGAAAVHVRGDMNSWGADAANQLVYEGDGVYGITLDLAAGTYNFKVASSDWSTVNLGASDMAAVTPGTPVTLQSGSNGNLTLTVATAGSYRFELDALVDKDMPVLTVTDALNIFAGTPMYLRGTITTWDPPPAANELVYNGGGLYQLTVNVAAAGQYEFKIAAADWSTELTVNGAMEVGEPAALVTSGSNTVIDITAAGNYVFTLNTGIPDAPTITVELE